MVPILEWESGMTCGVDFAVGYSPERVNPGDEAHTIDRITKVVAGMDEETTQALAELYGLITQVYIAKDIRTAEAAKVIGNVQRDLNIALENELSIIFNRMGLDTKAVVDAAATTRNFIRFSRDWGGSLHPKPIVMRREIVMREGHVHPYRSTSQGRRYVCC